MSRRFERMPVMANDMQRPAAAGELQAEGGRRNDCEIRSQTSGVSRQPFSASAAGAIGFRSAFTLVEMLVVITIIGILASLGTVAVFEALKAAKRARIKVEITNLNNAIESYKLQFGDYPPSYFNGQDANSVAALQRHLAKAFPRCNVNTELHIPAFERPEPCRVFGLLADQHFERPGAAAVGPHHRPPVAFQFR